MDNRDCPIVELLPPNKSGYIDYKVFNKSLFKPKLSVKVDLEYFKHYSLHYIYEKDTNSILGTNEKFNTSALIGSSPQDIEDFINSNSNNAKLIDYKSMSETTPTWDSESEYSTLLDIPGVVSEERLALSCINIDDGLSISTKLDPVQSSMVNLPLFNILLNRPWIDIPVYLLNLEPGNHLYIARLQNNYTEDIKLAPFGYCIQDDNPSKPYIYMDRKKK